MRQKVVAGNWKMNLDYIEAKELIQEIAKSKEEYNENILDIVDNNLSIEDVIILNNNNKLIKRLIDSLCDDFKKVIIYKYYKEMTFKQIAEKTNVSINTALGRHRYAINKLRKLSSGLNIHNFR